MLSEEDKELLMQCKAQLATCRETMHRITNIIMAIELRNEDDGK